MRRVASQLITWISAGLLSAVVFGPVGQFAVELAREKGWYDDPSRRLESIAAWFGSYVTQTPFLVVTALSAGLAIGLWLDTIYATGRGSLVLGSITTELIASLPSADRNVGH